ncbi:MAG: hypothetical protein OXT71_00890 [Acidobacteriota bacterium]|nr:hypothetical protein [Acidobacteriota bacterium]
MKHAGIFVMIFLSIFYFAAILFLRSNDVWVLLRRGDLNELGDFFAGVFTPLAFSWLVYGYFLQSRELRLQREELALTRKQLGKQTELLQEQVTADHQHSIPRLTLRIALPGNWWDWKVENKGGNAKNVELLNLNEGHTVDERNSLAPDEFFQLQVPRISSVLSYEARFSSDRSERFRQCWEIEKGKCKEITEGPERINDGREG